MRVRDHVALSTAGAMLFGPRAGRGALGLWAGGVLIDVDHYVWFCLRQRQLNPLTAVRFFDEADPPQDPATRVLHSPIALLAVLLASIRQRRLLPIALGMGLHVALDTLHKARMDQVRAVVLKRDHFSCQACGRRAPDVGTHIWRQPWLLPSYRTRNLISLCARCHEAAHMRGRESRWWT